MIRIPWVRQEEVAEGPVPATPGNEEALDGTTDRQSVIFSKVSDVRPQPACNHLYSGHK